MEKISTKGIINGTMFALFVLTRKKMEHNSVKPIICFQAKGKTILHWPLDGPHIFFPLLTISTQGKQKQECPLIK